MCVEGRGEGGGRRGEGLGGEGGGVEGEVVGEGGHGEGVVLLLCSLVADFCSVLVAGSLLSYAGYAWLGLVAAWCARVRSCLKRVVSSSREGSSRARRMALGWMVAMAWGA